MGGSGQHIMNRKAKREKIKKLKRKAERKERKEKYEEAERLWDKIARLEEELFEEEMADWSDVSDSSDFSGDEFEYEKTGPLAFGMKWAWCGEVDRNNLYFSNPTQVPHDWSCKPCPSGGIRSIAVYDGQTYVIDGDEGHYWMTDSFGQKDWVDMGGDGGSLICAGDGFLWAWCDCDPNMIYGAPAGHGITTNSWSGVELPGSGTIRSWGIYDGELYIVNGDGNYFRKDVAAPDQGGGRDWQQLAGDGGWVIAVGDGKIWAWCHEVDPHNFYHSPAGRHVEDLEWSSCEFNMEHGCSPCQGGMAIFGGQLHVVKRQGGGYYQKDVNDGEWTECGGDGGWMISIGDA